jgi:hypothetical protein
MARLNVASLNHVRSSWQRAHALSFVACALLLGTGLRMTVASKRLYKTQICFPRSRPRELHTARLQGLREGLPEFIVTNQPNDATDKVSAIAGLVKKNVTVIEILSYRWQIRADNGQTGRAELE